MAAGHNVDPAPDATPDGLQHLLARAKWDADTARDDVRDYVVEHLGDTDAVLVVDEAGDLKKGTMRWACSANTPALRAGLRTPRSKVAVYLVYATAVGHAAIDRELYVPRSWSQAPDRCRAPGIPDEVAFATKPALASTMNTRALDAGIRAAWVAADEVYGANPYLLAASKPAGPATSLPSPATTTCPPQRGSSGPTSWPGCRPHAPGSNAPQAPEPEDCASTTGQWPTSPARSRVTTSCWSAAAAALVNSPSTAVAHPRRCP